MGFTTAANNYHIVEMERSSSSQISLLTMPTEILQQIVKLLFHPAERESRPCEVFDPRFGHLGCHCGEALSTTCRAFYEATRNRYFNCAKFVFNSPRRCREYLESIGKRCGQIGSLKIAYTNTVQESSLLAGVFEYLKESQRLVHLEVVIYQRGGQPALGLPMHMPDQDAHHEAAIWDVTHRPLSHPLANLKSLQKLTITGHPGITEMEEVFFKARLNIENGALAKQQRVTSISSWDSRLNLVNFVTGTTCDDEWWKWQR